MSSPASTVKHAKPSQRTLTEGEGSVQLTSL